MMKNLFLFLILMVFLFFSNCVNNVEDVSTGDIIDPAEVSYQTDIQPIFNSSCGNSGCHISNTTNGVNLSSYDNVINSIGTQYGSKIVLPGDPEGSPIVDKIEPNPEIGSRMPLTGGALPATDINKIRAWIEGGAEDN